MVMTRVFEDVVAEHGPVVMRVCRALVGPDDGQDAWSETFDIRRWEEVFRDAGVDADWYALRARSTDEILPWDMIGLKIPTSHLAKEHARAHAAA